MSRAIAQLIEKPPDRRRTRNAKSPLLVKVRPVVVKTEEQNERSLAKIEGLMRKAARSPEEDALLELLVQLSDDFEHRKYRWEAATPAELIKLLLAQRQQTPKDLWNVLRKSRVSEILSGKRQVSKSQAVKLGQFFGVSPASFVFPLER